MYQLCHDFTSKDMPDSSSIVVVSHLRKASTEYRRALLPLDKL